MMSTAAMTAALPSTVVGALDRGTAAFTQGVKVGSHTMGAPVAAPSAKAGEDGKSYECLFCHKTFGRLFILKRHEKMHTRGVSADPTAPTAGRRKKAKCACTNCQASKQACDDQDTCEFCTKRGLVCERVAKPISTKRKTEDTHQPLIPHPPAERPPKSQSLRRKQLAPTITTSTSALKPLYNAGWGGASETPTGSDDMDDWDMSEASTVRNTENSATSDTLTLHDGYLSDDYEEDPAMEMLAEEDSLLMSDGLPYSGLTIRTTRDEEALADGFLSTGDTVNDVSQSSQSSPTTASPNGVFMMEEDEEMLDEFEEEEEEERLREQEQLLLIEQETMLRLEEQQRMNEQQHLQLLMMQNNAGR